jgi:hypothetical protein
MNRAAFSFPNRSLGTRADLPLPERARVKLTIEPLTEQLEPMEAWQSLKAWIRQRKHGTPASGAA